MSTITYSIFTAEGSEWSDSEGRTVLSIDGEWIADLDTDGGLLAEGVAEIRDAVANAIGVDRGQVALTPTGYTCGQTYPLDVTTTSTEWTAEVTR